MPIVTSFVHLTLLVLFVMECFPLGTDGGNANSRAEQIPEPPFFPSRHKRQSFSRYICGIPPFIFHSDIPCSYWAICVNHGFATNLPCSDNQSCLERNPNTECVQGTCCTLPSVQMPTTIPDTLQLSTNPSTFPTSKCSISTSYRIVRPLTDNRPISLGPRGLPTETRLKLFLTWRQIK
uniref:WAP domain-containing protein n=1 Tax=Globodera rostochiensis TaxID=31243 RepID=A0A914H077_GLORO